MGLRRRGLGRAGLKPRCGGGPSARQLAVAAVAAALLGAGCSDDDGPPGPGPGTQESQAPAGADRVGLTPAERTEVAETLRAVQRGGPFPYDQDGETFFNREGLLPDRPAGHYREYTVETPGSQDRGARRLVIGADGATYFTRDHYDSFERIDPADLP
jgi:ribonuclease T1